MRRNGFTLGTAVTPHDTNKLTAPHQALYVSVDGAVAGSVMDLAVQFELGTTVTFHELPIGTILPIVVKRVMSTGTTASASVVALWGQ